MYHRFSGLIRYLQRRGEILHWPLQRLEGRSINVPRERVLDGAELARILVTANVWRSRGRPYGTIIELLILTGQRRSQIGALERRHIDFDNGTINWPRELMKGRRPHTIPIGHAVRAMIESRPKEGLLFPNQFGRPFSCASNLDQSPSRPSPHTRDPLAGNGRPN